MPSLIEHFKPSLLKAREVQSSFNLISTWLVSAPQRRAHGQSPATPHPLTYKTLISTLVLNRHFQNKRPSAAPAAALT